MDDRDAPPAGFDFRSAAAVESWSAIDDRVMGGLSRSRLRHDAAGHAVFEGVVSRERNGGFASVRCRPGALGRPGAEACVLEARGDGRRYKLNLLTGDRLDGIVYQAGFAPAADGWQIVRLPLRDFRATFRGRPVAGVAAPDPAALRQIGLAIGDGRCGAFALGLPRILIG